MSSIGKLMDALTADRDALKDERDALKAECERERLRLAACGVAACSDTPESAKAQRIDSNNPYHSASYADVCRRTDECIRLRAEVERLKRDHLAALEAAIEKNAALREALEAIDKQRPKDFEAGYEYWDWGNYDDVYQYGKDAARFECAEIARAALKRQEGGQ